MGIHLEPADYRIRITRAGPECAVRLDYLELVFDHVAPDRIFDLEAGAVSDTTVELTWTVPGDDGTEGTAAKYDIRYHTEVITEENWGEAVTVDGADPPGGSGTNDAFVVDALEPSTDYYFCIKTRDELFNWSPMSNVLSVRTKDPVPTRRETWGKLKWQFADGR